MREKRFYTLKGDKDSIKEIIYRISPFAAEKGFNFLEIYTDDNYYNEFLEKCKKENINLVFERFEMEYTKKELESAKYLVLKMRTYCSDFSKEYGTEFSYKDRCECCGSGKKQISDLYIDKTKMVNKDISIIYDYKTVISKRMHEILLYNGITGVRFGKVSHKNNKMKSEPKLFQLFPSNILPPMNKKTIFHKEKFCEYCKKSGLFLRSLPFYENEDFINAKDFNNT